MKVSRLIYVLFAALLSVPAISLAADINGNWIAEVSNPMADSTYAHVSLTLDAGKLTGVWGANKLEGSLTGDAVTLTVTSPDGRPAGSLTGKLTGNTFAGTGTLAAVGRRPGGGGGGRSGGAMQEVSWKLTPEPVAPAKGREIHYDPKTFFCYYSAANKPDLHIFPGDIVHTWTPDAGGVDKTGKQISRGGDCNIGPIYIEGALPGDTLVVHLLKVRTNRATARQGSRINPHAATPAYDVAAKYDPAFTAEYHLDPEKGVATLLHASDRMKNFTVPIKPMLGCISVAPVGQEAFRGGDLGPWGGNLDYNDNVEGTTLFFPVSHPGALFGFGDGHAAMGDGEVTGSALETSMDVDFSVEVIRGYQTQQVRAETKDYIISFGVSGSVADSIQLATSQLATWIKKDYGLTDNEVALFLGAVMKYDITELVDAHYNVVAKVPKSSLQTLTAKN